MLASAALTTAALTFTPVARAQDAGAMRARETALHTQLANNPFKRPLVLESTQASGSVKGEIYAVVAQPYSVVGPAVQGMGHWCDILILHLNVKSCASQGSGETSILSLAVGRKFDQPVADAYRIDFAYRVASNQADYLHVQLSAEAGPLGTKNYRLALEAIPLDATSSFVHMSYAYAYGFTAQIAMQAYLATTGRDKVGFSVIDHRVDGTPVYTGDLRGVVERNTMRYYLAIEAYLGATSLPPAQQPEQRLRDWFSAVERYPRQLHEMERDAYLAMKRKELAQGLSVTRTPHPNPLPLIGEKG